MKQEDINDIAGRLAGERRAEIIAWTLAAIYNLGREDAALAADEKSKVWRSRSVADDSVIWRHVTKNVIAAFDRCANESRAGKLPISPTIPL